MSVSAAKSGITQARTLLESGRFDEVDAVLDVATCFIAGLPVREAGAVAADIARLRTAAVTERWTKLERDIAGWEQEAGEADATVAAVPRLPLTALAVTRTRQLLDDLRREHATHPVLPTAQTLFNAASAKLYGSYRRALREAEALPTPKPYIPASLRIGADTDLVGTDYHTRFVARVDDLEQRWAVWASQWAREPASA
jgi:hypothetical protein